MQDLKDVIMKSQSLSTNWLTYDSWMIGLALLFMEVVDRCQLHRVAKLNPLIYIILLLLFKSYR